MDGILFSIVMVIWILLGIAYFLNLQKEETLKTHRKELLLAVLTSIFSCFMIYCCIYYKMYEPIKWIGIVLISMIMASYYAIKSFKLYLKEQDEIRKICSSIVINLLEED